MPRTARRIRGFRTTVFSEFSALAQRHRAINLGQGFPDFDGPEPVREAAVRALRSGHNQYAIGAGAAELRAAIAAHAARFHGQQVDPETMVTVTSGATEAIFDTLMALVDPGDEVVLFEPFYDSYAAAVALAGAIPRFVPLRPPDGEHARWWFDAGELAAAFGEKTRLVVVNTPHNPTGKVFTALELGQISELCQRWDTCVLADEVYEHLAFAPARHLRVAQLPGLGDRTVTVSSAGKTFSFTGWKVGWAVASPPLREAVQAVHQYVTFATASPLQVAVAEALRLPAPYFERLAEDFRERRDLLAEGLAAAGLRPLLAEGTYFVIADISALGFSDDFAFCRYLTEHVGVAAIPPSAFYGPGHEPLGRGLARFAFCKSTPLLEEAVARLRRARWPRRPG